MTVTPGNPLDELDVKPSSAYTWRVERYLELGFTETDANLLATVRVSARLLDRHKVERVWTFPLHWATVGQALLAGCTHEQARRIYA